MTKLNFISKPIGDRSFMIDGRTIKSPDIVEQLVSTKKLSIEVSMNTKTTVSVSFQIGEIVNTVNISSPNFKTKEETKQSFLTGDVVKVGYFKILKSQGLKELLVYISEVFNKIYNLPLESVDAEITIPRSLGGETELQKLVA